MRWDSIKEKIGNFFEDDFLYCSFIASMGYAIYKLFITPDGGWDMKFHREHLTHYLAGIFSMVLATALLVLITVQKAKRSSRDNEKIIGLALKRIADLEASSTIVPTEKAIWPWGAHETENLRHLAAAAERYWKLYNPAEPDTAPRNETVVEWLKAERGVSDNLAKGMASILRADGLKTGPRGRMD